MYAGVFSFHSGFESMAKFSKFLAIFFFEFTLYKKIPKQINPLLIMGNNR